MSDDKFHLIESAKLGTLDETMLSELERLAEAKHKLEARQEEHDAAEEAFWDALTRQFGERIEELNAGSGFRITAEGDVFADFCKCPACQAELHGMSVTDVVEEMVKNSLLPLGTIEAHRQRAKVVDSEKKISRKLMN